LSNGFELIFIKVLSVSFVGLVIYYYGFYIFIFMVTFLWVRFVFMISFMIFLVVAVITGPLFWVMVWSFTNLCI